MRTVLTLFSGACGGWDLGMERAGYRVVAACEADPWRRAVLQRNFPNTKVYDDVRGLTAARLVADLGALPDVIVGSPPCQDASLANTKGRGVDGARTGLFFEFIRIVAECRPLWCCAENVPGLRTRGVDRVLSELEALDYACWPLVVGAGNAGAPHQRRRVFIMAADANEARRADGSLVPLARATTQSEPRCSSLAPWRENASEVPGIHGMDDGLPRRVAAAGVAAYGDAVVPQIAEAIGRAMLRVAA